MSIELPPIVYLLFTVKRPYFDTLLSGNINSMSERNYILSSTGDQHYVPYTLLLIS
jgi:hypothetical protein